MKNLIQAAVVTLFAASAAQAQHAVQWKVSDGGNGHWYAATTVAGTWPDVRDWCAARGGHLVTASQTEEWLWLKQNIGVAERWAGGFQDHSDPSYSEPMGGWRWVTGETFAFSNHIGPFDDCPGGNEGSCGCVGDGNQDVVFFTGCCANRLDDIGDGITPGCDSQGRFGIIEYGADCNADGIVDYGQCHDGTLPDFNGNNIPDCCERKEACFAGSYPVQWRMEDGGNGHWYRVVVAVGDWEESRVRAMDMGSELCAITSAAENGHVLSLVTGAEQWCADGAGYWLGGFKQAGQWQWTSGEDFIYSYFGCGNPGDIQTNIQWYRVTTGCPPLGTIVWDDQFSTGCPILGGNPGFVAEWDADCNNDNIVDYGQILTGQLADANSNGILDTCEGPTCRDVDLFRDLNINGADLGILLSQWGPNAQFTVSDFNKDGSVNGADLGLLLSFWGACP